METFIRKQIGFICTQAILALLLNVNWATAKNPKDDFCRRFAHQTTVIDDKLYIDGGWVNFDDFQQTHENYSSMSAQELPDKPFWPLIISQIPGFHTMTSTTSSNEAAIFGQT